MVGESGVLEVGTQMSNIERATKPGVFEKMTKKGYIYLANRGWVRFEDYRELMEKLGKDRWGE